MALPAVRPEQMTDFSRGKRHGGSWIILESCMLKQRLIQRKARKSNRSNTPPIISSYDPFVVYVHKFSAAKMRPAQGADYIPEVIISKS